MEAKTFASGANQKRVARRLTLLSRSSGASARPRSNRVVFPLVISDVAGSRSHEHMKEFKRDDRVRSQLCFTLQYKPGDRDDRPRAADLSSGLSSSSSSSSNFAGIECDNPARQIKELLRSSTTTAASLHCYWVYVHDGEVQGLAHSCCLIVDTASTTSMLFEPYGSQHSDHSKLLQKAIKRCVLDEYSLVFKQRFTLLLTNAWGPQIRRDETAKRCRGPSDPTGFCFAWCVHYVYSLIEQEPEVPFKLVKASNSSRPSMLRTHACVYTKSLSTLFCELCSSTTFIRNFLNSF